MNGFCVFNRASNSEDSTITFTSFLTSESAFTSMTSLLVLEPLFLLMDLFATDYGIILFNIFSAVFAIQLKIARVSPLYPWYISGENIQTTLNEKS